MNSDDYDNLDEAVQAVSSRITAPDSALLHEARSRRRRMRLLGVCGAVVACTVVVGVALSVVGERNPVETVSQVTDDNRSTTTTAAHASTTSIPLTTITTVETTTSLETEVVEPARVLFISEEARPDGIFFVRGETEIVFLGSDDERSVFDLDETDFSSPSGFIESVSALGDGSLLVGVCCEPASGLTLHVTPEDGSATRLQLDGSFPSTSVDGSLVATADGYALRTTNLEQVLLNGPYESEFIFEGLEGQLPLTTWTASGDLVAALADRVVLTSRRSDSVEVSIQASDVAFDYLNGVVLALDQNGIEIHALDPVTLGVVGSILLPRPAVSFDILDGWLLLGDVNGRAYTAPIDNIAASVEVPLEGIQPLWSGTS